jgi:hypothetical protein
MLEEDEKCENIEEKMDEIIYDQFFTKLDSTKPYEK